MYSMFMQNYFCHLKNNIYFIVISKNACTSLKNIAIREKIGRYPLNCDLTHDYIGYSQNDFLFLAKDIPKDSIKFAVYRDPVDRLLSVYKHFCIKNAKRWYFDALELRNVSFDRFIKFVDFEITKTNPLNIDEHIRKQSDYFNINDIDFVVKMEDINIFLEKHGIVPLEEKYNNTSNIKDIVISKQQENHIIDLYSKDYEIIKSNKVWNNK